MVAKDIHYVGRDIHIVLIDGTKASKQKPRNKANTIESVDPAGKRCKPKKSVRGLGNRTHAGRRGPILHSPRGVHVLGADLRR